MRLRRNTKIIAPKFQVWAHNEENILQELPHLNEPTPCHYLHIDSISSAAISLCQEHGIVSTILLFLLIHTHTHTRQVLFINLRELYL